MRHLTSAISLAAFLATATTAHAQTPQPLRLVGSAIGSHWEMKDAARTIVETATLTFPDADRALLFTVDFVAQHQRVTPEVAPAVVDMIITQHPAGENTPRVTLLVNGEARPVVARRRSASSIVASMPFEDFVKLAGAEAIVERAFDTELEFGAGQMRMLRSVAQRWAGQ